jgi:glycosyltransferase involved in cell wall biosynthesis
LIKPSDPLVTVLMPVYNGVKYLSEAINSILNQTYENFEFMIIDDCSTDQSIEIIKSFTDNRIRLIINEENIGQSKTLNKGIGLAKGKYIARLDQDDLSYKERLQTQLDKISGLNKTIIGSWVRAVDEKSLIIGYIRHPLDNDSIVDSLAIGCALTHSSIFMRKEDIISLGGYSEKYRIAMDWDLWVKAAYKKYNFLNISKYLIGLRQHTNQASKNIEGKKVLNKETLQIMNSSKKIIKSKENLNAYIGWKYYHEIMYILGNNKSVKSVFNLGLFLMKFESLFNLIMIWFYHKIIKNPNKLYNVPILFTKK